MNRNVAKTYDELLQENSHLQQQLEEAADTIHAIRTGQVDALVVQGENGDELYTLKSADQSYRVFIEKMTEGAVTLNRDKIILYSNSRFAAMVNRPLLQVLGLPFDTFIDETDQERFQRLFQTAFQEDCKVEIQLTGGEKPMPCQLAITRLDLDEETTLSIILTDLTSVKETQLQLKKKNEELEHINHALELSNIDLQQFAYVASHDLQEPLRKIQMFSSLLQQSGFSEVNANLYLEKIITSSRRMKLLIGDILNYSRLSATERLYLRTDLNALISDLLEDYEVAIKDKKAQILVKPLPEMEIIAAEIRQVFQNLISNALKFSKKDTSPIITIAGKRLAEKSFTSESQADGPYCAVSVKDNGIGFNQLYAQQVFTLFQRLHSKDQYEGTGIGLAISKKIIEKHNGLIHVNSIEGLGSEFTFILPVRQNGLQPAPR